MTLLTWLTIIIVGSLVAVVVAFAVELWRRNQAPALNECEVCGTALTDAKVHRLTSSDVNDELDPSEDREAALLVSQTMMIAEYCPKHCPGGCTKGCERVVA